MATNQSRRVERRVNRLLSDLSMREMGFIDIFDSDDEELLSLPIRKVGGGFIIAADEPYCNELHIVPHGGTGLPASFYSEIPNASLVPIVELILLNRDAGTAALAKALLPARPRPHIAYFSISRLLLDANRLEPDLQLPAAPYIGEATLYQSYAKRHAKVLLKDLLEPWIMAVNELIAQNAVELVFHHHTMDPFGYSVRPHDARPGLRRPPAQVFLREYTSSIQEPARLLAPVKVIEGVRETIFEHLMPLVGEEAPEVRIDDPLVTPAMPFIVRDSNRILAGSRLPWHIIIELRKDLLRKADDLGHWTGVCERIQHRVRHSLLSAREGHPVLPPATG